MDTFSKTRRLGKWKNMIHRLKWPIRKAPLQKVHRYRVFFLVVWVLLESMFERRCTRKRRLAVAVSRMMGKCGRCRWSCGTWVFHSSFIFSLYNYTTSLTEIVLFHGDLPGDIENVGALPGPTMAQAIGEINSRVRNPSVKDSLFEIRRAAVVTLVLGQTSGTGPYFCWGF